MSVLLACLSVHVSDWYPQRYEDLTGSPATGVMDGCKLPRECRELNLGPLQEQYMFLTTEPTLQPQSFFFLFNDRLLFVDPSTLAGQHVCPCSLDPCCSYSQNPDFRYNN